LKALVRGGEEIGDPILTPKKSRGDVGWRAEKVSGPLKLQREGDLSD